MAKFQEGQKVTQIIRMPNDMPDQYRDGTLSMEIEKGLWLMSVESGAIYAFKVKEADLVARQKVWKFWARAPKTSFGYDKQVR